MLNLGDWTRWLQDSFLALGFLWFCPFTKQQVAFLVSDNTYLLCLFSKECAVQNSNKPSKINSALKNISLYPYTTLFQWKAILDKHMWEEWLEIGVKEWMSIINMGIVFMWFLHLYHAVIFLFDRVCWWQRIHVIQISSGKFLRGAIGIWVRRVLYCAGLIVHILLMGKRIH